VLHDGLITLNEDNSIISLLQRMQCSNFLFYIYLILLPVHKQHG